MATDHPPISFTLRYEEAVVLSDLLARWDRDGTADALPFEDQAEQRVLWDLGATLETVLDDVFSGAYAEVVRSARAAVRDAED